MSLIVVNYQITLKNTCKNEPAKRLKQPVLRRQGRNGDCPTEGIDTIVTCVSKLLITGVEMGIARQRALTHIEVELRKEELVVEMRIARHRAQELT